MTKPLTEKQMLAIKCAYADLVGSYQSTICSADPFGYDWKAHRQTISEMEEAFSFLEPEPIQGEITYFIMCTENNELFWSNEFGWSDRDDRDEYTKEEKESFNLPMGGEWGEIL
jgi:hypothetical protein